MDSEGIWMEVEERWMAFVLIIPMLFNKNFVVVVKVTGFLVQSRDIGDVHSEDSELFNGMTWMEFDFDELIDSLYAWG